MKGKTYVVQPPDCPDELPIQTSGVLSDAVLFEDVCLEGLDWCGASGSDATFNCVEVKRCNLSRAKLRSNTLRDTTMVHCEAGNVDWTGVNFQRVMVRSTRLTGANLSEAKLTDVTVHGCVGKLTVFVYSKLTRVAFERCDLSEALFEGAALKHVRFRDCDLRNTRLIAARIDDVDLRGSQIEGIQIPMNRLKGVVIDPMQASEIAAMTGAQIRELTSG